MRTFLLCGLIAIIGCSKEPEHRLIFEFRGEIPAMIIRTNSHGFTAWFQCWDGTNWLQAVYVESNGLFNATAMRMVHGEYLQHSLTNK